MKFQNYKQFISGMILSAIALLLTFVYTFSYAYIWIINLVPIFIVTAVVLICCRKSGICSNVYTVVLGIMYGVFLGAFGAAALGRLGTAISPRHSQHPLDRMAYGIIMVVCSVGTAIIMLVDYLKKAEEFSFKRVLLQFCIAGSIALALLLPLANIMDYFEVVFSQFVA